MASIQTTEAIAAADVYRNAIEASGVAQAILYDGTPPASVRDALSGNNVLRTIPLPAYNAAISDPAGGRCVLSSTPGAVADAASGTVSFLRIQTGAAADVMQMSCSGQGGGGEVEFDSPNIQSNAPVTLTQLDFIAKNEL